MRPSKAGLHFLILLLVCACTFTLDEPSGITREISPVKPTGSISLTDYINVDTIYLSRNDAFYFDIKDLNGTQFVGEASFNNILFFTFNYTQGQFNIPDTYFKTGTHKLKLTFNQHLNDQSLLGKFKDRKATIFKEWVVVIDIEPPSPFEITVSNVNGYIKYTWPARNKKDFLYYGLRVNPGSRSRQLTVTDPTKNFYIDSTYVDGGDAASINVTVYTTHGDVENFAVVNEPPIKFSMVFHSEDTTASFAWSKPKYYGALKSYTISDDRGALADITTAADTTLNLKIDGAFPSVTQIHFKMLDKIGMEIFEADKSIDFFVGNAMPTEIYGQFWYYSKTANKFIARAGAKISIYDDSFHLLTTRTVENNMFYGMTVAWPGTYLHYMGSGNTISQLNLVTNDETSMTIEGEYTSAADLSAIWGAENQVVSFSAYDNDHVHFSKDLRGLADMQTKTVLLKSNDGPSTSISDDGKYSSAWTDIYSVSGATQTLIGTIPNNYYIRWFRGDNTDEIITTQYDASVRNELQTIIVRSSDMQILRTYDPPEAGYSLSSYDPATKTLLYTKYGATKVYLVNIETGSKKVFKALGSYGTPLLNGIIIIGTRYIKAI